MSDIPITVSKQFQYADDIALTFQANSFAECETTLEADLEKLDEFFRAPVWLNSVHISKIDVQLNNAMRIISGCVKSTQLPWLPTLACIAPPQLRRKAAAVRELVNCNSTHRVAVVQWSKACL
jgi:hypothetical protein